MTILSNFHANFKQGPVVTDCLTLLLNSCSFSHMHFKTTLSSHINETWHFTLHSNVVAIMTWIYLWIVNNYWHFEIGLEQIWDWLVGRKKYTFCQMTDKIKHVLNGLVINNDVVRNNGELCNNVNKCSKNTGGLAA